MSPGGREHLDSTARALRGVVLVVHPVPVAATVLTSIVMVALVHRSMPAIGLLLRSGGVVLLSQLSVGALNDYVDRDADARFQPEKPIARSLISARVALLFSIGCGIAMLPLAASLGAVPLELAVLGTLAGLTYDIRLKRTPAALLAYLAGFLTLLTFAVSVAGRFSPVLLLAYPAGALIVTSAYLAQSFPDIDSDRQLGHRGLAVLLGPHRTLQIMALCYAAVAGGGLMWSALHHRFLPVLPIIAGTALMATGYVWARQNQEDRTARRHLFRFAAPALALLAAGVLLAAQPDF